MCSHILLLAGFSPEGMETIDQHAQFHSVASQRIEYVCRSCSKYAHRICRPTGSGSARVFWYWPSEQKQISKSALMAPAVDPGMPMGILQYLLMSDHTGHCCPEEAECSELCTRHSLPKQ